MGALAETLRHDDRSAAGGAHRSRPPAQAAGAFRGRLDRRAVMALQRTAGNRAVGRTLQRYAYCTPARMSGNDCPPRETGEVKRAHDGAMVFLPSLKLDTGETGTLIANFDIGSGEIKPKLKSTIYWQDFLKQISGDKSRWSLVGFSDCEGDEKSNAILREKRAKAVLGLLPAAVQARIVSTTGADPGNCITENDGPGDRTLNRSVAFVLAQSTFDEDTGEDITDSLKREEPPTSGCSPAQKDRLAVA